IDQLVQLDAAIVGFDGNDGVPDTYQILFLQFEEMLPDLLGLCLRGIHDCDQIGHRNLLLDRRSIGRAERWRGFSARLAGNRPFRHQRKPWMRGMNPPDRGPLVLSGQSSSKPRCEARSDEGRSAQLWIAVP